MSYVLNPIGNMNDANAALSLITALANFVVQIVEMHKGHGSKCSYISSSTSGSEI